MKRLLFLSNGFGEDAIGARIASELKKNHPSVESVALPLVGKGAAYERCGIPLVGPTLELPSGGFNTHDHRAMRRDLNAGLLRLLTEQFVFLRDFPTDGVVAVGDFLPILLGKLPGKRLFFVGANKSDYYRDRGSRYLGIELALMKRWKIKVFPRDAKTHERLASRGLDSEYLGNPMMDAFANIEAGPSNSIVLLPGSRDEAYRNIEAMLPVVEEIDKKAPALSFVMALAPSLSSARIGGVALSQGWLALEGALEKGSLKIILSRDFERALLSSALVIGLAGTANEQAVGLGKPVIAWPGEGPQYSPRFARLQRQLLGEALTLLPYEPEGIASKAIETLKNRAYLDRLPEIGRERLGQPGAAGRIAARLAASV